MKRRFFRLPRRSAQDITIDVDDELRFHLDARIESLVSSGMAPEQARAQAIREFGDVENARLDLRAIDRHNERARRRKDYMGDLKHDITYALRTLRNSPAFTLTAVLTLALGIGANAAIFSLVNGVLLRPLPFPEPEQLVRAWSANRGANSPRGPVSPLDIDDWRAQKDVIADIGGYFFIDGGSGLDFTGLGDPQRLSIAFVTPGFFSTLGVNATPGRLPREEEMVRGGDDKVIVLSHGFWQRQFGGSAAIVGTTLTLNSQPHRVLGVMPPSFRFPSDRIDGYVPYSSVPDESIPRIRPVRVLAAFARIKPGRTIPDADAELNVIARRLAAQYPDDNTSWDGATVESLQDTITGPVRRGLYVLMGAVAFVLIMACVNVANLLLARAAARERELAVRVSLGGTRGRILRQLLTESLVLAVLGGAVGLLVARGGLAFLLKLSAGQLPRGTNVHLDGAVILFAMALSLATGVIFGLVPSIRASRPNLQQTLRESGRSVTAGQRLRSVLVVAQVALAVLLVVGAGLMTKSFIRLLDVDPGFRPDNLVAVQFTINTVRHPSGQYVAFYRDAIERVRELPGVLSAGAVKDPPFRGEGERWGFVPEGMVLAQNQQAPTAQIIHVSDGYFGTIGARMLSGREYTRDDRPGGPLVVVINDALARQYYPGQDAVGKTLGVGGPNNRAQIVGVVGDIRQSAMAQPAQPTIYVNNMINSRIKTTIVVRTAEDPLVMARRVRDAVWELDKDQTITAIFTFDEIVSDAVARPRLLAVLMGAFGMLGLGLGALGIYGLLAYLVAQRQREIGVRLALGASGAHVLRMIVGRGVLLALIGVAVGVPAALYFSTFMREVLFEMAPIDPATFIVVVIALLAVAAVASLLPARRAAKVDPVITLRYD